MIQYAFALEDANRSPEGLKLLDEVAALLKAEAANPTVANWLPHFITQARAHFARATPASAANVRKDLDTGPAGRIEGCALFVKNGGVANDDETYYVV